MRRSSITLFAAGLALLVTALPGTGLAATARDRAAGGYTPKPIAQIAIAWEFGSEPAVGQPLEVALSISSGVDMSGISVNVAADDPLAIIEPVGDVSIGSLPAGESASVPVTVLPLISQSHRLGISVSAFIDGIEQTRSITVPIHLPTTSLNKTESVPAGFTEQRVRSFDAIETVR